MKECKAYPGCGMECVWCGACAEVDDRPGQYRETDLAETETQKTTEGYCDASIREYM